MSSWPVIDREPMRLPTLPGRDDQIWITLIELATVRPGGWTLIGGQMVLLHAIEHGAALPRISTDLDLLVNARVVAGGVREFVAAIEQRGFVVEGMSPEGVAHRYQRNGVSIDVLAPEGLGARANLTTTPPGHTLQVPGGSQALHRTELLPVEAGQHRGLIPRPSLLGAIIAKAAAVDIDDAPDAQRLDLAVLLTIVTDPTSMATELTHKDRRRLKRRSEMLAPDPGAWTYLPPEAADRGRAAYRLLAR